ncbi:DUF2218 domain-containing protein [Metapseudomonas boanensis]|uniref:DUF2218 domain-containing protein n=1 Tax=Metapseudomonas boanensis TaxID=2822138 RepID=A0ABS5XJX9_9GAMM|nr:DUF2218 domain-containing protein [Pseudomonas boanensis]MBT8767992.1 DUF2218 domain-containing protein [Pseudomonas boanensis]
MTLTASAYVATPTPARYISRLCKHFAHRVTVEFDEQRGRIEFDLGLGLLRAEGDGLTLSVESQTQEGLDRLQEIVGSHFVRVAWQEELQLEWNA